MKTALKILAAVDRSPQAVRVVKHAIDLAKTSGADLHFLFVKVPYGEPYDKPVDVHRRLFINEQIDEQDAEELNITHAVREADEAAQAIVEYADENECELILMGTHGRRGIRKLMLGSVAQEVIRTANSPVLTIGANDQTEAGQNPFSQILVPFDFSDHSEAALSYAVTIGEALNANLEILHVVEDNFYPAFYGPFLHSIYESKPNIEELAAEKMRRSVENTGFDMRRVTLSVIPGHPGSEIARYADEHAIDLIIMATHGLSGMQHLFLGSVTERTVQLAKCPVLTLRTSKDATDAERMEKEELEEV